MEAYIQALITSAGVIMGVWGFVKVVRDIKATNDVEVKWRDRVDKAVHIVEENADKWNKGLADIYAERSGIVKQYNERLDEQDAKIQQLYAMSALIIKAINVLLEERVEKGANGDVKKMHAELSDFLTEQIGK
jgi:hypothetical protein